MVYSSCYFRSDKESQLIQRWIKEENNPAHAFHVTLSQLQGRGTTFTVKNRKHVISPKKSPRLQNSSADTGCSNSRKGVKLVNRRGLQRGSSFTEGTIRITKTEKKKEQQLSDVSINCLTPVYWVEMADIPVAVAVQSTQPGYLDRLVELR